MRRPSRRFRRNIVLRTRRASHIACLTCNRPRAARPPAARPVKSRPAAARYGSAPGDPDAIIRGSVIELPHVLHLVAAVAVRPTARLAISASMAQPAGHEALVPFGVAVAVEGDRVGTHVDEHAAAIR